MVISFFNMASMVLGHFSKFLLLTDVCVHPFFFKLIILIIFHLLIFQIVMLETSSKLTCFFIQFIFIEAFRFLILFLHFVFYIFNSFSPILRDFFGGFVEAMI